MLAGSPAGISAAGRPMFFIIVGIFITFLSHGAVLCVYVCV